mmetsp:Transcript_3409/g.9254  ORF Transcript_3409/g.9254 Transcript_3409/m.9254 type:complete len:261 (-) Transcript_3409:185-967(-)
MVQPEGGLPAVRLHEGLRCGGELLELGVGVVLPGVGDEKVDGLALLHRTPGDPGGRRGQAVGPLQVAHQHLGGQVPPVQALQAGPRGREQIVGRGVAARQGALQAGALHLHDERACAHLHYDALLPVAAMVILCVVLAGRVAVQPPGPALGDDNVVQHGSDECPILLAVHALVVVGIPGLSQAAGEAREEARPADNDDQALWQQGRGPNQELSQAEERVLAIEVKHQCACPEGAGASDHLVAIDGAREGNHRRTASVTPL